MKRSSGSWADAEAAHASLNEAVLFRALADARTLGRCPTQPELGLRRRSEPGLPLARHIETTIW